MILVKADRVGLVKTDGKTFWMPPRYGIIHDPEGQELPKCTVYFAPWTRLNRKPPPMSRAAKYYYGETYKHQAAKVDIPRDGEWKPVLQFKKILYHRRGVRAPYGFHHGFVRVLMLEKCKRVYRVNLGICSVDDRGFVWP